MLHQVALALVKSTLLLMLVAGLAACGGATQPSVSMIANTPTPAEAGGDGAPTPPPAKAWTRPSRAPSLTWKPARTWCFPKP